jgi:hypothetical protein
MCGESTIFLLFNLVKEFALFKLAVIERKFSIGTPCFCFLSDGSKLGDRIVAIIKLCILVMYFPEKILRSFPMCSVVQIIPHIRKKSQATLEKCPDP